MGSLRTKRFSVSSLFHAVTVMSLLPKTVSISTSTSASEVIVPQYQVCVLGGGIGGCAAISTLMSGPDCHIERVALVEMGRDVGGRASTRFSRDDDRIAINHGAPHADVRTAEGRAIFQKLNQLGFVKKSSFQTTSQEEELQEDVEFWTGDPSMNQIAKGLLHSLPKLPETMFKTMARDFEPLLMNDKVIGWRLKDKDGNVLLETEWLIVSGSGVAHPRWTAAFGGEPPLLTAARKLKNNHLDELLTKVGSIGAKPVQAALMAFDLSDKDGNELPEYFDHSCVVETPNDMVLDKIVIQRSADSGMLVSVVAHSNAHFAESAKDTYGSKSTAARIGGAQSTADREAEVLEDLVNAVTRVLGINKKGSMQASWGPYLHRWGNAFPLGSSLSLNEAIVDSVKIAFCGDFVGDQSRFGTLEGALISGQGIGQRVKSLI